MRICDSLEDTVSHPQKLKTSSNVTKVIFWIKKLQELPQLIPMNTGFLLKRRNGVVTMMII